MLIFGDDIIFLVKVKWMFVSAFGIFIRSKHSMDFLVRDEVVTSAVLIHLAGNVPVRKKDT